MVSVVVRLTMVDSQVIHQGKMLPSNRTIGILAVCIPFWFFLVYGSLASIRPEFSHLHKAVSELGSVDAPYRWIWNVGGYIISGLVIALLGIGLVRNLGTAWSTNVACYSLVFSGLMMVLSGVFPGDFENRTSFTMVMHTIGALGTFIAFLICGFMLPRILLQHPHWKTLAWPSLMLVILSIAVGFLRTGNTPGLGQRLGFACFFAWIGLMGWGLLRNAHSIYDQSVSAQESSNS